MIGTEPESMNNNNNNHHAAIQCSYTVSLQCFSFSFYFCFCFWMGKSLCQDQYLSAVYVTWAAMCINTLYMFIYIYIQTYINDLAQFIVTQHKYIQLQLLLIYFNAFVLYLYIIQFVVFVSLFLCLLPSTVNSYLVSNSSLFLRANYPF